MMSDIAKYSLFFMVAMTVGYFVSKYRENEQHEDDVTELNLIKRLLLDQSPLYGQNRPIIWIHTKHEKNARKWKSFYSRTST